MSKFSLILLAATCSICLVSCNNDAKSKALVRTWRIDDIKTAQPMDPKMQGFFQQRLQEMRTKVRTTFYDNGTYMDSVPGKSVKGKWQFSKDETKIIITDDRDMSQVYNITTLTSDKFCYDQYNQGDKVSMTFVPGSTPVKPVAAMPMEQQQPEAAATSTDSTKR
jgi:Lipocalin-like domain